MSEAKMARSIYCYDCKAVKENPNKGYCRACNRKRDNEWRLRTGQTKKHQTGLCPCGAERAPGNKSYCQPCANKQSSDWRKANGWKPEEIARANELRRKRWREKHPLPERKRKKGTLINGEAVNCKECNMLSEGWCERCDALYHRLKESYHTDAEYKLKHQVRALTRSYIKAGILEKGACEMCNTTKRVQAHHEDYSKPLDVIWLCQRCHDEVHLCKEMGIEIFR